MCKGLFSMLNNGIKKIKNNSVSFIHDMNDKVSELFQDERNREYSSIYTLCWYLSLGGLFCYVFGCFEQNKVESISSVLNTIITCLGIIIAIIITYFFSKLYSERSERIIRKQHIDKYAIRITAVRRISSLLKSHHDFWNQFEGLKHKLNTENKHMTLPEFRSLDYDSLIKLTRDLGEDPVQTYLSIKYLEKPSGVPFNPFSMYNHRNYTLNELENMEYACSVIWNFFSDYYKDSNWANMHSHQRNAIEQNLKVIYPNHELHNKKLLVNVFSDIQEDIQKAYYLTFVNKISVFKLYGRILINILVFVVIILISVFLLNIMCVNASFYKNIIVSVFIVNLIDFFRNIYKRVKTDLNITEIYRNG